MNKIDYLEKNLTRQLEWIKAADTRITLVLPLSTAMLGALALLAPKIGEWASFTAFCSIASTFFLVLSIIFLAIATFPRINAPKDSLIYFGTIQSNTLGKYKGAIHKLDDMKYENDLINQCHINAQIADIKFKWVTMAIKCLFISSLPWALSIYLLYSVKL